MKTSSRFPQDMSLFPALSLRLLARARRAVFGKDVAISSSSAQPRNRVRACLVAVLSLCSIQSCPAFAGSASTDQHVETVFSELRALKFMEAGKRYTVRVGAAEETGLKEQFLRRRTAREIIDSGLSCGCGDCAVVFMDRIQALGFSALLVDGAEISSGSFQNHFSGHAVVAIRNKGAANEVPWWLVDSTNLRVISTNWSREAKSFRAFGRVFWIGFCGPLADYPVHDAEGLKAFYAKTLAEVPRDLLNSNLCRIDFTIDPSLIGKDGEYLNPRIAPFLQMQSEIFRSNGIKPLRGIPVRLVRGDDDSHSSIQRSQDAGWVGRLGLQSGCGPGLLAYFEREIQRNEPSEAK